LDETAPYAPGGGTPAEGGGTPMLPAPQNERGMAQSPTEQLARIIATQRSGYG